MTTIPAAFELGMANEAMFSVPDAAGLKITCRSGTVWITLDGDPRDFVLERCDSFSTESHSRALIYAMKPASITIADAPGAPPRRARVFEQIAH